MSTATKTPPENRETKVHRPTRMEVKQVDPVARTFEGLASTWDLDLGGDVIERGAFEETLDEWRESGRVLPLLDSHNWFSVRDAVGRLTDAEETDEGLWTQWKIVPGRDGDEILQRLRPDEDDGQPFIDSMSIGYVPTRWEFDEETGIRTLKEVELHEVSLVLFPMNPEARIDSGTVKDRAARTVHAMFSRCSEGMRGDLARGIREALETPDPDDPDPDPDPKSDPAPAGTGDDPPENTPDDDPEDLDMAPDPSQFARLTIRRLEQRVTHTRGV